MLVATVHAWISLVWAGVIVRGSRVMMRVYGHLTTLLRLCLNTSLGTWDYACVLLGVLVVVHGAFLSLELVVCGSLSGTS